MPKEKMTCGWCGEEVATAECPVRRFKNDYGAVIEHRCPRCHKVLAAYLEEEGHFLPEVRNF